MSFNGLADYAGYLESRDDLIRVRCRVDPVLEITEIADRMVKNRGKALLFEDTGTGFPLLINAYASDERMAAAIGRASLEDAGNEILAFFDMLRRSRGLLSLFSGLPRLLNMLRLAPVKKHGRGPCQEIVERSPDLSILPALMCWPHDGGRYITLPLVHTRHPLTGSTNVGMYRMQIIGRDVTAMHWHRHKTGAHHYEAWKKEGRRMPVTVTLGGDPVYTYAATAPVPEEISEYILAAFLRHKRVKMVKCLTNELWIPADSDIVIEGYVDPSGELLNEGPFGDHTGFYSLPDFYPAFHVTCITYRRDAVYPATIVGVPPMEDAWISKATEKIFLAPLKLAIAPEIKDIHMPAAGASHNLVIASIEKTFPGQGMKVLSALFGAGQMMLSKYIIVVSSPTSVHDYRAVAEALFTDMIPERDLFITNGPLDVLDHSSDRFSMGGKLGIDATVKLPGEHISEHRPVPLIMLSDAEISDDSVTGVKTLAEWSLPVVILTVRKPAHGLDIRKLISSLPMSLKVQGTVILAVDDGADADDLSMIIWLLTGNTDPSRDLYRLDGVALFIDATSKACSLPAFPREWPNVVCSDIKTIELADRRWGEYGTGDFYRSPSLKLHPLLRPGGSAVKSLKGKAS